MIPNDLLRHAQGSRATTSLAGSEQSDDAAIDRSMWRGRVYSEPDLRDLRERVDPFWRVCSFTDVYRPARKDVKERLDRTLVLQLILQHLDFYGFSGTSATLAKEAAVKFDASGLPENESRLVYYLRNAVQNVDSIYDLVLDETTNPEDLEEILSTLDLLEPETEVTEAEANDCNIWQEPEGDLYLVYMEDDKKQIKAATLNKLVVKMTSDTDFDQSFVDMLLMTYKSFTTPDKMLTKIIQRFQAPSTADAKAVSLIQMRVGLVLKRWLTLYIADFDEQLTTKLHTFLRYLRSSDNKTWLATAKQLETAYQKASSTTRSDLRRQFNAAPPQPKVSMKHIFQPKLNLFDIEEEELARQICLADFAIYTSIESSELLNQSWSKPKTKHKSPNVLKFITRFNNLSNWVASSILKAAKLRQRAKVMSKCIKLAEHLKNLHNFNGCMAILAGINSASVYRLRWTRKELPPRSTQILGELEEILSSARAFQLYRETIAQLDPPCIPYLGVYLTDLTFIDENPDNIGGLINFFKRRMIYNVISKIQQYQNTHYNLQPVWQIQKQLQSLPTLDEQTMHSLSLKREPRHAERSEIE